MKPKEFKPKFKKGDVAYHKLDDRRVLILEYQPKDVYRWFKKVYEREGWYRCKIVKQEKVRVEGGYKEIEYAIDYFKEYELWK